jgi:hypothetical protein
MPRSIHVLWLSLASAACAQPSQSPAVVTAPSASTTPASTTPDPSTAAPVPAAATSAPVASASAPAASPEGGAALGPGATDAGVAAQFRGCQSDADCITVPRAGCCNNGWKEAVAASQKDAYAKAYACTAARRPVCPMYIVRDTHIAKCDTQQHLCVLAQP